jgi:hypothetical protein
MDTRFQAVDARFDTMDTRFQAVDAFDTMDTLSGHGHPLFVRLMPFGAVDARHHGHPFQLRGCDSRRDPVAVAEPARSCPLKPVPDPISRKDGWRAPMDARQPYIGASDARASLRPCIRRQQTEPIRPTMMPITA